MHEKMGLTHTDLKPENILLKLDTKKKVMDRHLWPIQVQRKKEIYENDNIDDISESEKGYSQFSDNQTFEQEQEDGCTGGNVGKNFD
jgi:serine/threonine protein kinase